MVQKIKIYSLDAAIITLECVEPCRSSPRMRQLYPQSKYVLNTADTFTAFLLFCGHLHYFPILLRISTLDFRSTAAMSYAS